ncbi:MAG: TlpA family protein disulfide reductase [Anaerolineae bacterium]|nr:MAG: TlpA family protein disulfide reductase [Anaerolineae bacterium]
MVARSRKPSASRKRASPGRGNVALIVIGAGLLLIGLAAALALPRQRDEVSPSASQEEISAVPVPVEYPAPDLSLTDLQGNPVTLADYRGQIVLVNLWATWCPPCRAEMPVLQSYYEAHQEEGFVIIAINDGDPEADVTTFAESYGLTFPVWLDPEYRAERSFQTMSLPSSFVIDRQGIVRLAWTGAISRGMLEKHVTPLIGEQ